LALADTETRIAFAYDTIKNDKDLLSNLEAIIEKENVAQVVIGIPGYVIQTKDEYDEKSLGMLLEVNAGVQVAYQEEMFTSKMAQDNLRARGDKRANHNDDKEAAKIILQSFLDK
jgi:RNase H-fold protein (predicted Holliday junction resolvase)